MLTLSMLLYTVVYMIWASFLFTHSFPGSSDLVLFIKKMILHRIFIKGTFLDFFDDSHRAYDASPFGSHA